MSEVEVAKQIRARFTDTNTRPENTEYGDEHRAEYALLNGVDIPKGATIRIPYATSTLRVNFPAGTDFVQITRCLERIEAAIRVECSSLVAEGVVC